MINSFTVCSSRYKVKERELISDYSLPYSAFVLRIHRSIFRAAEGGSKFRIVRQRPEHPESRIRLKSPHTL